MSVPCPSHRVHPPNPPPPADKEFCSVQPGHRKVCLAVVMSPHNMGLECHDANMGGGCMEGFQVETELLDSRMRLHSNFLYTPPAIFDITLPERLYQSSKPHQILSVHFKHHQGSISAAVTPRTIRVLCFYCKVQNQEQLWLKAAS